jgi:hypothetical protein
MAAGGLTFAAAVYAASVADMGLFELDEPSANATDDPNVAGDDANQIYCDQIDPMPRTPLGECDGVAPASASQQLSVFVADKVGDGDDTFTGGGSKDTENTTSWLWEIAKATPEKDDIANAFATIYAPPGGDTILYVGLDRSANNGDAAIGFWILQNDTELVPGVPPAKGTFSAPHKVGDVLIQSDILQGGTVSRFDVYTWQANGLTQEFHSTNCGSATADDRACGLTNLDEVVAPWPFIPKFGTAGTFPEVSYFEGGVNLTELFPEGIPCLSTFLAETRTAQSETAQLKDFALGEFELCGFNVAKTAPAIGKVGDDLHYSITITNTGAVPLIKEAIVDSLVGDLTNDPGCGDTLAPNTSCTIEYDYPVPTGANPNLDLSNTVTATYNAATSELPSKSSTATTNLFKPGVTLVKKVNNVDAVEVFQGDSVNYKITVDNTSSTGTPDLVCTVTDALVEIDPENTDGDGDAHSMDVVLASGAQAFVINASSDALNSPGEITNTAYVTCAPSPYTNTVSANDSVKVTVVQRPVGITVDKTGSQFSKVGDDVNYVVTIGNPAGAGKLPVRLTSIVDNRIGNLTDGTHSAITSNTCPITPSTLAVGATCTIGLTRTTLVGDADPFINTVTVTGTDAFATTDTEQDSHSTDLVAPAIEVTKSCVDEPVRPGDSANFTIRVTNTGNVELSTHIVDSLLGINQTVLLGTGTCVYDSDPGDGCLEIEDGVTAGNGPVSNTVTVTATLPDQYGLDNSITKEAGDTCDVAQGDATRTLGFWKSHGSDGDRFAPPVEFGYTCHVADTHVQFPIDLGWKTLVNCEDVFGIFWSSPAKQTNGLKRPALCQSKLHASWQLLAAILNEGLDNGATVPTDPVSGLPADDALRLALKGTDRANIIRLAGLLGGYNESGDDVAIEDNDGAIIPPADPNGTKSVADLTIGNCQ